MERFGTAGIRGAAETTVAPDLALGVGRAVGLDAADREDDPTVVVARDGRRTGPALLAAVEAGLLSAGVSVRRAGRLPTPALAFASRGRRGVMLTASHNPPADNGIKLFVDGVEYDRSAERRIERRLEATPEPVRWDRWTEAESGAVLGPYRQAVVGYAARWGDSIDGLKIAIDCGNGMAGLATPWVLRTLGADVVAVDADIDGRFPARGSKPTATALRTFRRFVADEDSVFGIAHDGDADRIVIVDGSGNVVDANTVIAILAERFVDRSAADDPVVVTTPNASSRIDERVEAVGGRVERVELGSLPEGMDRVRRAGGPGTVVAFAAEPWKHIHPRFGGWIDAVASAAVLARFVAAAGGLDRLTDPVSERPYRTDSIPCPEDRKATVMSRLETILPETFPVGEVAFEYGIRIDWADGSWILVRRSGTEPVLRVYVEGEDADDLLERVRSIVDDAVGAA